MTSIIYALLATTSYYFLLSSPSWVTSHAPITTIMSRRTLGGGRVLGSAKSLPPAPSPHSNVLSPSTSSLSLSSQASASQFSSETHDFTSRISLENGDTSISAAPAATGAQLSCPICNEEMVCMIPVAPSMLTGLDDITATKQVLWPLSFRRCINNADTSMTYIRTWRTIDRTK